MKSSGGSGVWSAAGFFVRTVSITVFIRENNGRNPMVNQNPSASTSALSSILRRLCQLHGLADEHGNRLLPLKPEFASDQNPYPWSLAARNHRDGALASQRIRARNARRDAVIRSLHDAGFSGSVIAEMVGLSKARVYQVLSTAEEKVSASLSHISANHPGSAGKESTFSGDQVPGYTQSRCVDVTARVPKEVGS